MRRPCLGTPTAPCPNLASPGKPRCPNCTRATWRTTSKARPTRPHYNGAWTKASQQARHWWLTHHGPTCPGHQKPPHTVPPNHLTVDHIQPQTLAAGIRILCRSCNSSRRDRTNNDNELLQQVTTIVVNDLTIPLLAPTPGGRSTTERR